MHPPVVRSSVSASAPSGQQRLDQDLSPGSAAAPSPLGDGGRGQQHSGQPGSAEGAHGTTVAQGTHGTQRGHLPHLPHLPHIPVPPISGVADAAISQAGAAVSPFPAEPEGAPGADAAAPAGSQASGMARRLTPGARSRRVARQFLKFGIVGASGFVVNQAVFVASKKLSEIGWSIHEEDALFNLLGSQYNLRWYQLFAILAFVVANLWNFVLNRYWTFGGMQKRAWYRQLPQFMAVGVFGLLITLLVLTALVNPQSPVALPESIFDNSSGLRTRAYWGNFIGVMVAVPANFLFNKFWTFRGVHHKDGHSDSHGAVHDDAHSDSHGDPHTDGHMDSHMDARRDSVLEGSHAEPRAHARGAASTARPSAGPTAGSSETPIDGLTREDVR